MATQKTSQSESSEKPAQVSSKLQRRTLKPATESRSGSLSDKTASANASTTGSSIAVATTSVTTADIPRSEGDVPRKNASGKKTAPRVISASAVGGAGGLSRAHSSSSPAAKSTARKPTGTQTSSAKQKTAKLAAVSSTENGAAETPLAPTNIAPTTSVITRSKKAAAAKPKHSPLKTAHPEPAPTNLAKLTRAIPETDVAPHVEHSISNVSASFSQGQLATLLDETAIAERLYEALHAAPSPRAHTTPIVTGAPAAQTFAPMAAQAANRTSVPATSSQASSIRPLVAQSARLELLDESKLVPAKVFAPLSTGPSPMNPAPFMSGRAPEAVTGSFENTARPVPGPTLFRGVLPREARPTPVITHDDIAHRARQIWHAAGCPEGCAESHWLQAEWELRTTD